MTFGVLFPSTAPYSKTEDPIRPKIELHHGDCLEVLRTLPDNSIDSLVTDPPYGIRFMGKAWDGADIVQNAKRMKGERLCKDGITRGEFSDLAAEAGKYSRSYEDMVAFQKWTEGWAREVLRVLKPGAHAIVHCSPRSYHRMTVGMEDAGFEIRDQLQWLFGSGFPKSLDVSKAIDKAAGAERRIVGHGNDKGRGRHFDSEEETKPTFITAPATDAAKQWAGWGTALKPANEPILLARKPLEKGLTVAQNVLKWGTGALNIDASRINAADQAALAKNWNREQSATMSETRPAYGKFGAIDLSSRAPTGRFPANLLLSCDCDCEGSEHGQMCAVHMLDAQSGTCASKSGRQGRGVKNVSAVTAFDAKKSVGVEYGDSGGASRFFFIARHDKKSDACGLEPTLCGEKVERPSSRSSTDGCGNKPTGQFLPDTISITRTATHSTISFPTFSASAQTPTESFTLETEQSIEQSEASSIESVSVASNGECLVSFSQGARAPIRGTVRSAPSLTSLNGATGTENTGTPTTERDGERPATNTTRSTSLSTAIESTRAVANDTASGLPLTRFFYCAKISSSERNAGLEGMEKRKSDVGDQRPSGTMSQRLHPDENRKEIPRANTHPTVKPQKLMRYLARLVTPPGGTLIDPFMGSGSTGLAALSEGFGFVGIERELEYFEIASKRIEASA